MNDAVVNVVSGLAAGITGTVLGHPLDTVKTMMQSGGGDSAVSTLRRLAKEGRMVSSLYAGVTPPLVSSVLLNAVCFAAYSHQEQAIRGFFSSRAPASLASEGSGRCEAQDDHGSGDLRVVASSAWEPAIPWIAGSSVGFISSFISTPFEVVKRQQQVSSTASGTGSSPGAKRSTNSIRFASALVSEQGVQGLFRGYPVNTVREMAFLCVYFGLYTMMKTNIMSASSSAQRRNEAACGPTDARGGGEASIAPGKGTGAWLAVPLAGGVAGALAWAASYPLDSVCTRVMTSDHRKPSPSTLSVLSSLVAARGVGGRDRSWPERVASLYRGVGLSMARASIVSSTRFSTYECVQYMLSR